MLRAIVFILLIFTPFIEYGYSSRIYGNIYDINDFNLANNCVIYVNSTPSLQKVVSTGIYDISLKKGCYVLKVNCYDNGVVSKEGEANLCVDENENITYDLLVSPIILDDFENLTEQYNMVNVDNHIFSSPHFYFNYLYLLFILVPPFVAYMIYKYRKLNHLVRDDSMKKLLDILKRERRINQKDLVRIMRLSDAKISLMIAELEKEGIIKKIKKGRSNIVIYKG